jgi:anti-sigma regulatory factor (Ser/Thr protein kinase)
VAPSTVQFPIPPSRSRTVQLPVPAKQLTVPTNDAKYHTYRSDLSQVRALVLQQARDAGLAEARANDLVLAVSEVAANTLRHTRSPGTLAIWHDDHEVVCEIRDEGTITDPHVGKRKPPLDASGGHGLWLVRQVCDLVELTSDANGTTVRMHMTLRPPELRGRPS